MPTLHDFSGAEWRKSSRSMDADTCVEVTRNMTEAVGVRDSKDPDGPKLAFTPAQWALFLNEAKSGAHDA